MNKKRWSVAFGIIILFALGALISLSCSMSRRITSDHTVIETPYCTLRYPEEWKAYLTIEQKQRRPLVIAYYAQLEGKENQHLFDIGFDSGDGNYVGSLCTTNGNEVKVYVELGVLTLDDSWTDEDKQIILGMYDDLSYLLENLELSLKEEPLQDEEEIAPTRETTTACQDMVVNTPYCDLYYPGEWADQVVVSTHQNGGLVVSYSALAEDEQLYPIFDVCFMEDLVDVFGVVELDDGQMLGVKFVFYPLDEIPENQRERFEVMQEAANYIVSNMPIKELPTQQEEELQPIAEPEAQYTDVEIDTPYAKLVYCGKWKDQMRIQTIDGEVFIVEFYGIINSKSEVYLFSICLGVADDEATIVLQEAQKSLGVGISISEIAFDDTWSEDEKYIIGSMQEEVNYIIENIVLK